ncbi:MAG: hypothetical protein HYV04_22530 [Deltaproteobacteria bacterium]|nr:hypothetical protein [Deltaproteobacteria bacterium]
MATVKEAFTAKHQGSKNAAVEEVSFPPGEEVQVLKEWKNDACLIKSRDGKVFNVPKKYLNLG